jgi:hypothetical protein
MSFVGLYVAKNFGKKVRRKKIRGNISKKSAEKNPKIPQISGEKISQNPLNFGGKIPQSQEKLPGFSNPKNLRTLFSE